jgi:hypothetical protein
LEESIESTIQERDLEKREEGEMFEMNGIEACRSLEIDLARKYSFSTNTSSSLNLGIYY